MTGRVSVSNERTRCIVAIAAVVAVILAFSNESTAQTSASPLIKIPPAQMPAKETTAPPQSSSPPVAVPQSSNPPVAPKIEPAPRELLPTKVQILRDSQGTGLAMYGTLTGKTASAAAVVPAIFAYSQAFDPTPSIQLLLADQSDRHAQALFTAAAQGVPVIGVVAISLNDTGGDVTVFYDKAGAFEASFLRMQQALAQDGVATSVLSLIRLADGNEVGLPPGWRITAEGAGLVELRGPQGEAISLGMTMPVYSGDPEAAGGVAHARCCDSARAFEALFPQIAAMAQPSGAAPRELVGLIGDQPVEGSGNAVLILSQLRVGGQDFTHLALVDAVAGFTEPWTLTLSSVMAPQPLFAAELPTLLAIWKSYRGAEPVFDDAVWRSLQAMKSVREMLSGTTARRETADYNPAAGWQKVLAAIANANDAHASIEDTLAEGLIDDLSQATGARWHIVPPNEFK
jgi:hypothetical protein